VMVRWASVAVYNMRVCVSKLPTKHDTVKLLPGYELRGMKALRMAFFGLDACGTWTGV
jgi:hypothetical protein